MGRISRRFEELQQKREKALVTFVTAGDPDLSVTEEIVLALEEGGVDIIELGVPFSDPMADGPTIQLSSERALASGTTLPKILEMVKSVRRRSEIPLLLMGYYNPVFLYGVERFFADAALAGVDAVLIVDLPPEEAGECKKAADANDVDLIFLLTPTSDASRIAKVAGLARGFIYYVSVTGVTGARKELSASLRAEVAHIKEKTSTPVVAGFGISDPAQAAEAARLADGVVVGSALVKLFEQFAGEELKEKVRAFSAALKQGIRQRP